MTESLSNQTGWIAVFGASRSLSADPAAPTLHLLDRPGDWSPGQAEFGSCRVIFDGVLHNKAELAERLGLPSSGELSAADVLANAFERWNEDALHRIKGIFALVVWNAARGTVVCARDPLGMHPLHYARVAGDLLVSPSIDSLLAHPRVPRELNRARLVDYLARRWSRSDETCFTNIQRVPPGHALRVAPGRLDSFRYWDPLPAGRPIDWVPDGEAQERFGAALEEEVRRSLALGPAGIYLSGGLDSSTIAMAATDLCRRAGSPAPWALSLSLPGAYDEEGEGRAIADDLGMQRLLLPYDEAIGSAGMVAAGLKLTRNLSAPLFNVGAPAFLSLSKAAAERACRVILTGDGGDEWLGMSPRLAANMLHPVDLPSIYRLWRALSKYYHTVKWASLRGVLWQFGARPLLRDAWRASSAAAWRFLPGGEGRTRASGAQALPEAWIAPDPGLRAQIVARWEASPRAVEPSEGIEGAYKRILRSTLDSPHLGLRAEEAFALGRHTGVRQRDPFWGADLIDLLVRIHPRVRRADGVSKALTRGLLSSRFPLRGFESQRKSPSRLLYIQSAILSEAAAAARGLGDKWVLGDLGVVDAKQARLFLANPADGKGWRVWDLLNLEAWARARSASEGSSKNER